MNLKSLTLEIMLIHSSNWLTDAALMAALANHPLGSAIMGEIAVATTALTATHGQRAHLLDTITVCTEALGTESARFQQLTRGMHKSMGGLAQLAVPDVSSRLRSLRQRINPAGLDLVNHSFMDQAGVGLRASEIVSPVDRQFLATQAVGQSDLDQVFQDWIDTAARMGTLCRERARAEASIADEGVSVETADRRGARYDWIRATRMLVDNMDKLPLTDDQRRDILAPLRRDIRNATRDRSGEPIEDPAAENPTEDPTEDPTEAPTEDPTEAPTEAQTDDPTEAQTDDPTDDPTDDQTEIQTVFHTDDPGQDEDRERAELAAGIEFPD